MHLLEHASEDSRFTLIATRTGPERAASCVFAVRLVEFSPRPELRSVTELELRSFFSTLARLRLVTAAHSFGVHYAAREGRVRVYLVVAVHAFTDQLAHGAAGELWEGIRSILPGRRGGLCWELVESEEELMKLWPKSMRHHVELRRRSWMVDREKRMIRSAFHLDRLPLRDMLETLQALPGQASVQVWAQAAPPCKEGISWEVVRLRIMVAGTHPLPCTLGHLVAQVFAGLPSLEEVEGLIDMVPSNGERMRTLGFGDVVEVEEIFSLNDGLLALRLPLPGADPIPGIKVARTSPLLPPTDMPTEGVLLGQTVHTPRLQAFLDKRGRGLHTYVIGQTGTGKTTLLQQMIIQDMRDGQGLAVLDPHGDMFAELLEYIPPNRMKDIVLLDATDVDYPLGINLLEARNSHERDMVIQFCVELFYKLFDPNRTGMVGPQWEHWFRNAALTLLTSQGGGTLLDVPLLFTNPDIVELLLHQDGIDASARVFWEDQMANTSSQNKSEMLNYFVSKFGRFISNSAMRNIIGQRHSAFDLRQLMDKRKILLVNLSKGEIGEMNSRLLGTVLVAKLFLAAASRSNQPRSQRHPFHLYVDEFQNFATDTFAHILSEARKFGLNLVLAHQFAAQLDQSLLAAVLGNVGNILAFRVASADAERLAGTFASAVDEATLSNLPSHHAVVRLTHGGDPLSPYLLRTLPLEAPSSRGGAKKAREFSRRRWGQPRDVVERLVASRLSGRVSAWAEEA